MNGSSLGRIHALLTRRAPALPLLSALLLLAFLLRSIFLDQQSLWADEAYSLSMATRDSLQQVLNEVLAGDPNTPHTPLYYLLLMPWLNLAGTSDFALRWFSVAFGLLTVPVSYVLAKRLTGPAAAILVALLCALSPFLVYYSQEARMYSMAGLIAALMAYFFLRGQADQGTRWWFAYSVSAIALFFTLNIGLVLIVVLLLISLLPEPWGAKKRSSSLFFHLPILLSALLWQAVQSSRFQMSFIPVPFDVMGIIALDTVKDTLLAYTLGVTLDKAWAVDRVYIFRGNPLQSWDVVLQPHYTTALALGAAALASFGAWRLARARAMVALTPILGMAAVVGSVLLLRFITISYGVRLTLIVAPLFLVFLALGLLALPGLLRTAALALLVMGMSYSLWQNYQNPVFSRSDYRALAQHLDEELQEGDGVYLHGPVLRLLDIHYVKRPHPTYTVPRSLALRNDPEDLPAQLNSLAERHRRLWLVLGGEADYDRDRRVERWLLANAYQVEDRWYGNSRMALFVFPGPGDSKAFPGKNIGDDLDLLESTLYGNEAFIPGQELPLALTWKKLAASTEKYRLSLRILDAQQGTWVQRDMDLGTYLNPVSIWPVGQPVSFRTGLRLPLGIPPGSYFLKGLVYKTGGEPLSNGELGPVLIRVMPGPLEQRQRLEPPNKAVLDFGALRILGYQLLREVSPGATAALRLYWEAEEAPEEDYSLVIRFGTASEQVLPLVPAYPTSRWEKSRAFVSQHLITAPASSGQQTLNVGLAGKGGSLVLPLTSIQVEQVNRDFGEPPMQRSYRAGLGERVELMGIDLGDSGLTSDTPVLQQGSSLDLTIYWKALREMQTSYTVFVQLLNDQGKLVAQEDMLPLKGQRPTTGWLPGEILRDTHSLRIPDKLPPGRYSLIAGMYDATTGKRLETAGQSFVPLVNVGVQDKKGN